MFESLPQLWARIPLCREWDLRIRAESAVLAGNSFAEFLKIRESTPRSLVERAANLKVKVAGGSGNLAEFCKTGFAGEPSAAGRPHR